MISIVFIIILVIVFICAAETCASSIQEEQANITNGVNVAGVIEGAQSASQDVDLKEKEYITEDSLVDTGITENHIKNVPLGKTATKDALKILRERIENCERTNQYPLDRFPEIMNMLKVPLYTLAKDFPRERIEIFNDFLTFSASIVADDHEVHSGAIYEHPLVKMRLGLSNPVRYEDFLAAVLLSLSLQLLERGGINHSGLSNHYIRIFISPSRNSFLTKNIIEPLSHDLAYGKYRGYHFKSSNLPQFIREFADSCYLKRMEVIRLDEKPRFAGIPYPSFTLVLPEELYLLNYYAETFLHIYRGKLNEAYKILYSFKMPRILYKRPPRIRPGEIISPKYRLFPPRPYYYYSDDDRYQWFCYLQAELRSAGHSDYADSILEAETEHYRELIIWQLQLRAYLTEKLFEYGDISNLTTLEELLVSEYTSLKNNPEFQMIFENAIEALRNMDDKVQSASPIDTAKGEIILPWIDREAIDRKQGIETEVLSTQQNPITWKKTTEEINDETKEEMKNSYEKAIYYIRVLAVISERLNQENDLETMVQLHSKLAGNTNVNCTPTGIYYQYFSNLMNSNKDSEDIFVTELSPQAKLDQRRYYLIVNDFWGWQARRKNGDLSVGEIILPWVAVQDK